MFQTQQFAPVVVLAALLGATGPLNAQRVSTSGSDYVSFGRSRLNASVSASAGMTAYRTPTYTRASSWSVLSATARMFYAPSGHIAYIGSSVSTDSSRDSTTYNIYVADQLCFRRSYTTGDATRSFDGLSFWRDLYDRDPSIYVSVGGFFVRVNGNIGCHVDASVTLGQSRRSYSRLSQSARVYGDVDARVSGFRLYVRKRGRVCDVSLSGHARADAGAYPRVYGRMALTKRRLDVLIRVGRDLPWMPDPRTTVTSWTSGGSTTTLVDS